jgi:hypothetical protein
MDELQTTETVSDPITTNVEPVEARDVIVAAEHREAVVSAMANPPVILQLGLQSRKRVKQLRNGRGPLMTRVLDSIEKLKAASAVPAGGPPVIVVVREREDSLFD